MDSIQNDQFKNFTMVRQYDATDLSDGKNNYDEGYTTMKQWLKMSQPNFDKLPKETIIFLVFDKKW